jgi:type II secretory pathway pseudopilin PulG
MIKFTKNNTQAFSLVEVLVAISILLLTIVTPMTILSRANNSTTYANEQLVAYFLAQEGLEMVQKLRDDIFLTYFSGNSATLISLSGLRLQNCVSQNCGLFMGTDGVVSSAAPCAPANQNCRLFFNTNSATLWSRYVHAAGPGVDLVATPYSRQIRVVPRFTSSGDLREFMVTSTVSWRTGSLIASQQVELVTFLANIYDI